MTLTEHALRGTIRAADGGCRIELGLPWFRSMPFSAVLGIEGEVDFREARDVELLVGDAWLAASALGPVGDRSWFLQDRLGLRWRPDAPLGRTADVVLRLRLHLPFLAGPGGASVQVVQEVRGTLPVGAGS